MKGPFSIFSFFGITLWIDLSTHLFVPEKEKRINPYNPVREVTVIIPVHSEPLNYIKETVNNLVIDRYPKKNIIICGDNKSDDIENNLLELVHKNDPVIYIKAPHQSKAKKINYIVSKYKHLLGEFVYIRDCRVSGLPDCVEKMISYFHSKQIAAVTSYGRVRKPKNFLSKSFYYGKDWVNEIGRFRKNSQEKRKAVFVICGASTIFRTEILSKMPIPSKSKTEDTYYTWILQKNNNYIRVADDTMVSAPDVDGIKFEGIKSQIKQSYRWTCGTMQCIYSEGKSLFKNKRLAYSTIIPGFIEAVMYSIPLVLIPVIFLFSYKFAIGFLIGDAVFTFIGTLFILPRRFFKTIYHYPQVLFFKYLNSLIFIVALFNVTKQSITGDFRTWSNEWSPLKTESN